MPDINIRGTVSDRHGIPLRHALRLDTVDLISGLETQVPAADDFVLSVIDDVLGLTLVSDLPSGGSANGINLGAGAEVFKDVVGSDLRFRTLINSSTVTITENADDISFAVSGSGVDHGLLGGLSDDDHLHYLLTDGNRQLSGDWEAGSFSIGINVLTPARRLEILDNTDPQLRLTHTDDSRFTDLQAHNDATYGGLAILPAANASSLNVISMFGLTEGSGLVFLDDPVSSALWIRTTQAKDLFYHTASTNAHKFQLSFGEKFWIQDSLITFFEASKYAFFQASTNTVGIPILINVQSTGGVGADGIGAGIQWEIEDSSGSANMQAEWDVVLDDADVGTGRDSSSRFSQMVAGTLTELLAIGKLGETVFNDTGANVDVRIEGTGEAALFWINANGGIGSGNVVFSAVGQVVNSTALVVIDDSDGDYETPFNILTFTGLDLNWNEDNVYVGGGAGNSQFNIDATFEFTRSLTVKRTSISADTTLDTTHFYASVDSAGAARIITLPVTDGNTFTRMYVIRRIGANSVTINPSGGSSNTINGSSSLTLQNEESVILVSNGGAGAAGNWEIVARGFEKGPAYTPTNVTTDRSYDANATTIDEIADVLGTLIADLQTTGIIG